MEVMGDLAEVYGLDPDNARIIGLLHDAGKDLDPERQQKLIKSGRIQVYHKCEWDYVLYLHGLVGAVLVQDELGINDALILEAIINHTYAGNGRYFDHPMCWCLRFADILEPNRDFRSVKWLYPNLERLRETVFAGRLAKGAYLQTGWILQWFQEDNFPIHPNMIKTHLSFAARLEVTPMFQESHSNLQP